MEKSGMISEEFWKKAEPLIPKNKRVDGKNYVRKAGAGRPGISKKKVLSGILYVLRKGIRWHKLPIDRFGCHTSIHRYFKQWLAAGLFTSLFEKGLANWPEMEGITWHWEPDKSCDESATEEKRKYAHRAWVPVYKQRRPKKRKSAKKENAQTPKQAIHVTQEAEDASSSLQEPSSQKPSPQEPGLKKIKRAQSHRIKSIESVASPPPEGALQALLLAVKKAK